MSNETKKLITHDGSFHADDVFAAAALSLMFEKEGTPFTITRTRDETVIKTGDIVFDVGGISDPQQDRFDHHQTGGAGKRENGIAYSSLGLIWKKYGSKIAGGEKEAEIIEKKLVAPIDAWDNGINLTENLSDTAPYLIQHVFFAMMPTWREDAGGKNEIFMQCVEFAKTVLGREIVQAHDAVLAEEEILRAYTEATDKRIIVLNDNYPFEFTLHKFPEPVFAIYPRKTDKSWGVKAIKADPKVFKNRKDLPRAWGGLWGESLQKITGVSDALFCHHALYLCAARSKESAIKLAQIALES